MMEKQARHEIKNWVNTGVFIDSPFNPMYKVTMYSDIAWIYKDKMDANWVELRNETDNANKIALRTMYDVYHRYYKIALQLSREDHEDEEITMPEPYDRWNGYEDDLEDLDLSGEYGWGDEF